MISYLKGKVDGVKIGRINLEVGGVGYKIFIPHRLVVKNGEIKTLHIYENIKEDCYDLYGFDRESDLEIFQKLLSVSGVGPKAGITILSLHDSNKIEQAISQNDTAFFTQIPGIGQKVSGKIIIELKSKISQQDTEKILGNDGLNTDIIEALISLGFKRPEAISSVNKIPKDLKTEQEKISYCLKNIVR